MNEYGLLIGIFLFITITLSSSRIFYLLSIKGSTYWLLSKLHFKMTDLQNSFDQMIYFISLPTHLQSALDASKHDLLIEKDFSSLLFPELKGIKVYVQLKKTRIYIAYLPLKQFRLTYLDKLLQSNIITSEDYTKICICKLTTTTTLTEIRNEIHKQIHMGRYELH